MTFFINTESWCTEPWVKKNRGLLQRTCWINSGFQ